MGVYTQKDSIVQIILNGCKNKANSHKVGSTTTLVDLWTPLAG